MIERSDVLSVILHEWTLINIDVSNEKDDFTFKFYNSSYQHMLAKIVPKDVTFHVTIKISK